jgi:cytochrome o ubiquinol oxidase operon protein cyoD
MSEEARQGETAPGDESEGQGFSGGLSSYAIGFALAVLLTVVSFTLPSLNLVWAPSLPVALAVLAIAQMGVHLVFFLHLTSGPDNVNNVLALAFGLFVVGLIIGGSLFIMEALNHNRMNTGMPM